MGQLNPPLPVAGQPNSTEDVKVTNALGQIVAVLNGNIDASNIAATLAVLLYSPGDLKVTASGGIPPGFLRCDGSIVSRAVYPNLYIAIGTAYGAGDGSTTFGLPDFRGRMLVGVGTHADALAGVNDGLAVASRTPKHFHQVITVNDGGAPIPLVNGRTPVDTLGAGGGTTIAHTTTGQSYAGLIAGPDVVHPQDAPAYGTVFYLIKT